MTDKTDPAFPMPATCDADGRVINGSFNGMTLRQWYAGQVLSVFLTYANRDYENDVLPTAVSAVEAAASAALMVADEMIKQSQS